MKFAATPGRLFAAGVLVCAAGAGHAQDKPAGYPLHPIRLIVGVPPGAGNDTVTRAAAQSGARPSSSTTARAAAR